MLVFVPVAAADLPTWAGGRPREVTGFAATPDFLSTFTLTDPEAEETELTLLEIAALEALRRYGRRLVVVCSASTTAAEPAEFGAVAAAAVPWTRVSSVFADDTRGAEAARAVARSLAGTSLADAWDLPGVIELVEGVELLWHGSSEWERLTD